MKDGLLKDIPVVVTAFSVLKLGATFGDRIMLYKIIRFIQNLDLHTQKDVEKYFKIKDYTAIGSKIILSLNTVADEKKIKWLSRALITLIYGK